MMKLAVTVLSLFLVLSPSQAKTIATAQVQESPKHSALKTPMRMRSVLARATPRPQRHLLIINDLTDDEGDDPPGPDELDLQSPYARPRVNERRKDAIDDEISDHALVRLTVARARALEIYRQKWA